MNEHPTEKIITSLNEIAETVLQMQESVYKQQIYVKLIEMLQWSRMYKEQFPLIPPSPEARRILAH